MGWIDGQLVFSRQDLMRGDCTFDVSDCDGVCGNGRIEPTAVLSCEECDGTDLGGKDCEDFGGNGVLR